MEHEVREVEQLWYTSSRYGLGTSGYQVRAISPGLQHVNIRRFEAYAGYRLPVGVDMYTANPATMPVCLALLHTGYERVLLRKTYVGQDYRGRPGNFFTHMLIGLPPDFSARDAIDMWDAHLWQSSDASLVDQTSTMLAPAYLTLRPDAAASLAGRVAPEATAARFAACLRYVMQAFLALQPEQHLYLAADVSEHEMIPRLIWGLLHSLPRSLPMVHQLTFSTYEQDVVRPTGEHPAPLPRIIGVCQAQDLPSWCYEGKGRALHCTLGKHSPLDAAWPPRWQAFIDFAVDQLTSGAPADLNHLLARAEKSNITTVDALCTAYGLYSAQHGDITLDDLRGMFEAPRLAAELLDRPGVRDAVLNQASTHTTWWPTHAQPCLAQLSAWKDLAGETQLQNALNELTAQAFTRMIACLQQHDLMTSTLLFNRIIQELCAPNEVDAVRKELHKELPPPTAHAAYRYSVAIHEWLLWQWAQMQSPPDLHLVQPWLNICWRPNELTRLLQVDPPLPRQWYYVAINAAIRGADWQPTQELIHAQTLDAINDHTSHPAESTMVRNVVARYHALFMAALADPLQLSDDADHDPSPIPAFYVRLNLEGYPHHTEFLKLLLNQVVTSPDLNNILDYILQHARLHPYEQQQILEIWHSCLIQDLRQRPAVMRLVSHYLDEMSVSKIGAASRSVLASIEIERAAYQLPESTDDAMRDLYRQARSWLAVITVYDSLQHNQQSLRSALDKLGSEQLQFSDQQIQAIGKDLVPLLVHSVGLRTELQFVLQAFGRDRTSEWLLFAWLFDALTQERDHSNKKTVMAHLSDAEIRRRVRFYVRYALAAEQHNPCPEGILQKIETYLQTAGRFIIPEIDKDMPYWTDQAQSNWHLLRQRIERNAAHKRGVSRMISGLRKLLPGKQGRNHLILLILLVLPFVTVALSLMLFTDDMANQLLPTAAPTISPGLEGQAPCVPLLYTVRANDTLQAIANEQGVAPEAITRRGGLPVDDANPIRVGDQLELPCSGIRGE